MSDPAEPARGDGEPTPGQTELLWRYLDRINAGETVDPEEILREHPEAGPELVRQLQAFQRLASSDDPEAPLGVLGDYTLRRQIGRGGMGVVYEAWQGSLDRRVALKVLPAGIAADDKAFQRFMREARTAAQLNHRNVVAVYGMGVEQSTPYFAMELVEGETLAQIVGRLKHAAPESKTPFGPKDEVDYFAKLARAFAEVADGLQHAHAKRIIHRDIKPSNLILDSEGRLRILDFGLARLEGQESLSLSGDVVGTPQYMSPEQARRKKIPVDHRTDVYSLGATLYEMLTLRPVFSGKDHQDTLSQIIERDPVEPRKVNARVPRDLETIVLKSLRKDAGDRYGTAEALGQDLKRFVRSDPIEARPRSGLDKWRGQLWRHWRRLAVAAVTLSMIAVTAAFLLQLEAQRARERLQAYERTVARASMDLLRGEWTLPIWTVREAERGLIVPLGFHQNVEDAVRRTVASTVRSLETAVRGLPRRFEGHYHLARGLILLERNSEALPHVRQALALAPDFAPALALVSQLEGDDASIATLPWGVAWSAADRAMRNGAWKRAVAAYSELIALEEAAQEEVYMGSAVEHLLRRGLAYFGLEDYQRAILDFQAARVLSRSKGLQFLEPVLLLAQAFHLTGQADLGERLLTESLAGSVSSSSDEDSVWIAGMYASLAHKLKYEGRLVEAADAARRALRFRPEDAAILVGLGRVLACWLESLGGSNGSSEAVAHEDLLAELSQTAAAAVAAAPADAAVRALQSRLLELQGDLQGSKQAIRQAIDPERGRAVGASVRRAPGSIATWGGGHFEVEGPLVGSCVSSAFCEWGVGLSWDGSKLFFGAGRPGDDRLTLQMAVWNDAEQTFADCRTLRGVNTNFWEGGATLSADGQTLYFESTRLAKGAFFPNLFTARWEETQQDFVDPQLITGLSSIAGMRARPAISVEGYELFFNSQIVVRSRNHDLWVAWRHSLDEPFTAERARPLAEINSPNDEFSPVLARDGKHLLWTGWMSDSHAGGQDFESSSIWCATRSTAFDPHRHAEPPPFETVHRIAVSPAVHAFSVAISGTWPAPGSKAYFVSCLASECKRLCDYMDVYEATWVSQDD